jgi:hypothetical protein
MGIVLALNVLTQAKLSDFHFAGLEWTTLTN